MFSLCQVDLALINAILSQLRTSLPGLPLARPTANSLERAVLTTNHMLSPYWLMVVVLDPPGNQGYEHYLYLLPWPPLGQLS